jgi:primosomal protein N' (replication factor Y)
VEALLPGVSVLRWDRDTAAGGRAHAELLDSFASGDAQVLVGTQMIAKGLHVPSVTLVGAVLADIGLHVPDFRAAERSFQVLCQVAGRAGRGTEPGRVIVQTYLPDYYAIQSAAAQDYNAFYEREMTYRRVQGDPPLGRLIRLAFGHRDESATRREAQRLARLLEREARQWGMNRVDVIGPAPAHPARLRGIWRWQILLRGADPRLLLDKVELPPNWVVDVDPVSVV